MLYCCQRHYITINHSLQLKWCQAVSLSAHISLAPTGWIYMKFDIGDFCENVEKSQILLKSGNLQEHLSTFHCRWWH
jgi:hypothetical protein